MCIFSLLLLRLGCKNTKNEDSEATGCLGAVKIRKILPHASLTFPVANVEAAYLPYGQK